MGCHALLQGIFLTQGTNPGFPHCRQILYHQSHQGSPRNVITDSLLERRTESVSYPFLQSLALYIVQALDILHALNVVCQKVLNPLIL